MAEQPVPKPRERARTPSSDSFSSDVQAVEVHLRLDDVRIGEKLGNGAYAEVRGASVPCAAKILHEVLARDPLHPRNRQHFAQECRILYSCIHPNIVRFYGVSSHPETGRAVLLLELLNETLTVFLGERYKEGKVPYYLQLNISHDIASGVSYLHTRGILHRDLSSNNVLLSKPPHFNAKISDFGMSSLRDGATNESSMGCTRCPGTPVYMPPEALPHVASVATNYGEKIDSFQLGVLMLQIVTKLYPDPTEPLTTRANPGSPTGISHDPVRERVRRESHLALLHVDDHPLLDHPILECLEDKEENRPTAECVCCQLSALMRDKRYLRDCEKERVAPRMPDGGAKYSEKEGDVSSLKEGLEKENKSLRVVLLREQETLKREKETVKREQETVKREQETMKREKETLKREEWKAVKEREKLQLQVQQAERVRDEQSAIARGFQYEAQQLRGQLEAERERVKFSLHLESEGKRLHTQLAQLQHERQAMQQENERLRMLHDRKTADILTLSQETQQLSQYCRQLEAQVEAFKLTRQTQAPEKRPVPPWQQTERPQPNSGHSERERDFTNHTCHVISGFMKALNSGDPIKLELEVRDPDGEPISLSHHDPISVYLAGSRRKEPVICDITFYEKRFLISWISSHSGHHSLCVSLGDQKCEDLVSLCVYPNPNHSLVPRVLIKNLKKPYSVAIGNRREMIVCENASNAVSVYDMCDPRRPRRFLGQGKTVRPTGVAVGDGGDVYVTSQHKLQKFSRDSGELLASIGRERRQVDRAGGEEESNEEFHLPSSVTFHQGEVYVSDQKNGRVQVFDPDLKYVRTVAPGDRFNDPSDVAFDEQGRMYVAEYGSGEIKVFSGDEGHLMTIGKGQRLKPESVHVVNGHLYVSDFSRSVVAVFRTNGDHVTSLGRRGHGEGEWFDPKGITSSEGKIFVCGSEDGRIHIL